MDHSSQNNDNSANTPENSQEPLITPMPVQSPYNGGGFSPVHDVDPYTRVKHSGLGIASFSIFIGMVAIFLISIVGMLSGIADLDIWEGLSPEELASQVEDHSDIIIYFFLMMSTIVGNLVGLILGIVGLVQKNRKKVFAILGTVFNGAVIGFILFIVVLALISAATAA